METHSTHPEDRLIDSALAQEERTSNGAFMSKPPGLPDTVAGYRVIGRLGGGGMGVVWEAEQSEPKRRVALKLLRSDHLPTEYHVHAFHREVRTLGRLKHPGIAAIYDAGRSDDGRPFFAMELIRGLPVTDYVDRNDVSLRGKLALFSRICEAVSHAHRRGIIHRDLKPSNILVEEGGMPKVLDFGLAKAIEPDPDVKTLATEPGRLLGTLAYMSPEQVRGQNTEVDTRTDVYALGVILFELLSGELPYTASWSDLSSAVRAICDQPSARLSISRGAVGFDVAIAVEKALAKDPAHRYQSVEMFAEDIRRALAGEPILARAPTFAYRLRKFVSRNKLACGLAGAATLAVLAGLTASTLLYFRVDHERARAVAEAERADTINSFLIEDMLKSSSAGYMPGEEITVRSVLEAASQHVETAFPGHPRLEANIRTVLANVYFTLNDFKSAEEHLERARIILEREAGPTDVETLKVLTDLARARHGLGDYAGAERIARSALGTQERVLGPYDLVTISTKEVLGNALALLWRPSEAERQLEKAYALAVDTVGERDRVALDIMNDLAVFYWHQSRYEEAIDRFQSLVSLRREMEGPDHPATAAALNNLGLALWQHGELSKAEDSLAQSLAIRERALPPEHPHTLSSANNLALVRFQQGAFEAAEELFREVHDARLRQLGPTHRETVNALQNLCVAITLEGDWERARPFQIELIALRESAAGSDGAGPADLGHYAFVLLASEPQDLRDPSTALEVAARAVNHTNRTDPWLLRLLALAHYQNGNMEDAIAAARDALSVTDPSDLFGQAEAHATIAAVRTRSKNCPAATAIAEAAAALPPPAQPELAELGRQLLALAVDLSLDGRFPLAQAVLRDLRTVHVATNRRVTLASVRSALSFAASLLDGGDVRAAMEYLESIQPLIDQQPASCNWQRGYARVLRGVATSSNADARAAELIEGGVDLMENSPQTPARELRRALELATGPLAGDVPEELGARLERALRDLHESR